MTQIQEYKTLDYNDLGIKIKNTQTAMKTIKKKLDSSIAITCPVESPDCVREFNQLLEESLWLGSLLLTRIESLERSLTPSTVRNASEEGFTHDMKKLYFLKVDEIQHDQVFFQYHLDRITEKLMH